MKSTISECPATKSAGRSCVEKRLVLWTLMPRCSWSRRGSRRLRLPTSFPLQRSTHITLLAVDVFTNTVSRPCRHLARLLCDVQVAVLEVYVAKRSIPTIPARHASHLRTGMQKCSAGFVARASRWTALPTSIWTSEIFSSQELVDHCTV